MFTVVVVPFTMAESVIYMRETVTYSIGLLVLLSINEAKMVAGPKALFLIIFGCAINLIVIHTKRITRIFIFFNGLFAFNYKA